MLLLADPSDEPKAQAPFSSTQMQPWQLQVSPANPRPSLPFSLHKLQLLQVLRLWKVSLQHLGNLKPCYPPSPVLFSYILPVHRAVKEPASHLSTFPIHLEHHIGAAFSQPSGIVHWNVVRSLSSVCAIQLGAHLALQVSHLLATLGEASPLSQLQQKLCEIQSWHGGRLGRFYELSPLIPSPFPWSEHWKHRKILPVAKLKTLIPVTCCETDRQCFFTRRQIYDLLNRHFTGL